MRRVARLLTGALARSPSRDQVYAAVVLDAAGSALSEVLPPEVVRRARPTQLRAGALVVTASSSVTASEVRLLSARILTVLARILERRGFGNAPTELRVRIGPDRKP